jgi:hypothetical protein
MVRKAYATKISFTNQETINAIGTALGRAAAALHHRGTDGGTRIAALVSSKEAIHP